MATARVTVTLPDEIVDEIDRVERNRSRFVLEAVRHELDRRRRAALERSLRQPHEESGQVAELGFDEWGARLPDDDVAELVDVRSSTPIRWAPGEGWKKAPKGGSIAARSCC